MTGRPDRSLFAIGYGVAALMIALPILEFTLTVWPPRGAVMWRFGAYGLLTQALMLPLLGMFVALLTARLLGHRRAHLAIVLMAATAAILQAAGLAVFLLDGLQARALARPDMQAAVSVTFVRAAIAAAVYTALWSWMAVAGYRALPRRISGRQRAMAEEATVMPETRKPLVRPSRHTHVAN